MLPLVASRFFSKLLQPVLMSLPKQFNEAEWSKISQFFREAFSLAQVAYKNNGKCDLKDVDQVEASMVSSFQKFVVKLNEDQLGPVILKLVKWAKKSPKELYGGNEINWHRQITMMKALSGVLEQLGEYAVPFLRLQTENQQHVLAHLIKVFTEAQTASGKVSGRKRARVESDFTLLPTSQASSNQEQTAFKLLTEVCRNLALNFHHDTGAFIQADIFEEFAEPLVTELLTLVSLDAYFDSFIENSLKPLVLEMNDRINNESLWMRFNTAILMKTRSEHPWKTRQAALKVVEHMFSKLGERYLVVLNDALPFLSESLEDEHPQVEAVAKEIVKKIETMTGETIQEYLK